MCAHRLYTVLHIYIFYIHMYIIYIFKSSRMHRNTTASISSHRPKHPHRGYLPTWGWGCVAGLGGGVPSPLQPPTPPPRARSLLLSSSPQSGAQDQARAARSPPPIPGASGRGESPFLGAAWPEPGATPLSSCYLWRVSLALEVFPLGFYPGEVEGGRERGGGGWPGCWLAVGSRCQQ